MHVTEDLIDLIWEDRPALSKQPLFILEEKYSGKSTADKIGDLRKAMRYRKEMSEYEHLHRSPS
jgi:Xaa-Pro aminopeptidase